MSVVQTKTLMTAEQFLSFQIGGEDDGHRFELLEGAVVVEAPQPAHHRGLVSVTLNKDERSRPWM